jgi:hypothetical protein
MSQPNEPAIQIRTPCPKRWEELAGDERRRFCSECSLHVHNSAALTQSQARALVADAQGRVCMRVEYDAQGAPIHRETRASRLVRWALASGAALLAACQGGRESAPAPQPAEPPSRMGKAVAQELGDVAVPEVQHLERLGEAVAAPEPAAP